jgi:hypothetical protein
MARGIPGVPKNFHGIKGRSGRKSAQNEIIKARVLEKAWLKLDKELETKDVTQVALPVALKDMAQKISNPDGSNLIPPQLLVKIIDGRKND